MLSAIFQLKYVLSNLILQNIWNIIYLKVN